VIEIPILSGSSIYDEWKKQQQKLFYCPSLAMPIFQKRAETMASIHL
jgi:hypothetical protein